MEIKKNRILMQNPSLLSPLGGLLFTLNEFQCRSKIGCAWKNYDHSEELTHSTSSKGFFASSKERRAEKNATQHINSYQGKKLRARSERTKVFDVGMRCEDAAEWRCMVKKKVLNCKATTEMSPVEMSSVLDKKCGRGLLGQVPYRKKVCKFGIRLNERCTSSDDCPLSRLDLLHYADQRGYKGKNGEPPSKKIKSGPFKGKYANAECFEDDKITVGCTAGVIKSCKEMGYDTLSAMIV